MIIGGMVGIIIATLLCLVVLRSVNRLRDWAEHRSREPFAKWLYEEMNLCYHNFKSEEGARFVAFAHALHERIRSLSNGINNSSRSSDGDGVVNDGVEFAMLSPSQQQHVAHVVHDTLCGHSLGPIPRRTCLSYCCGCCRVTTDHNRVNVLELNTLMKNAALLDQIAKHVLDTLRQVGKSKKNEIGREGAGSVGSREEEITQMSTRAAAKSKDEGTIALTMADSSNMISRRISGVGPTEEQGQHYRFLSVVGLPRTGTSSGNNSAANTPKISASPAPEIELQSSANFETK